MAQALDRLEMYQRDYAAARPRRHRDRHARAGHRDAEAGRTCCCAGRRDEASRIRPRARLNMKLRPRNRPTGQPGHTDHDDRRHDRPAEARAARTHLAGFRARYRLDQDLLRHRAPRAASRGQVAARAAPTWSKSSASAMARPPASRAASSPISTRPSRPSAPWSAWPSAPPGVTVQSVIVNVTAGRLGSETFSATVNLGGQEVETRRRAARAPRGQRTLRAPGALDHPRAAHRLCARRPEGRQGSARHGRREALRRCRRDPRRNARHAQYRTGAAPLPPADRGAGRHALCLGPLDAGR